jgi:glycosyltransferase involved in cell wall biosynthesis
LNILLIAQEPMLEGGEVASGNAIRMQQLCSAMLQAGHRVEHAWLAGPADDPAAPAGGFRNRDELQGMILASAPDVILLAFWELAEFLPFGLAQPVVLDFVAPRPLEELFERPRQVRASLRKLRGYLQRCDLVLVGNEQQRHLLVNVLIEAGFDLRQGVPVLIVPLGAERAGRPESSPGDAGWVLVAGGVSWPWRNSETYLQALAKAARNMPVPVKILQFEGAYRWHEPLQDPAGPADGESSPAILRQPLQPYREYCAVLASQAHIGIELADWNVERAYSQSFRSVDFLRHGLPLLCNRYLPLAPLVEAYDAGWLVDTPDQVEAQLAAIVAAPGSWQEKSAGALRLVEEVLRPQRSVRPFLDWLEMPSHAARLAPEKRSDELRVVLGVPPWRERLRRQFRLARQVGLRRLCGQRKGGHGVLFVSRADLFPADHGAAVRIVETARALAASGLAVGIVTQEHGHWYEFADGDFQRRRYPLWVHLLSAPAPLVKLLHYSKDLPYSNSFLYEALSDRGFLWRILAAGRKIHAGILQAEFPAYAHPCIEARDLLDCRVVLVEHNIEFERLRSQVPDLTDEQYRNIREIELRLCQQSDAVVCVSDNDRQKLIDEGIRPDLLHTILHGVRLDAYRQPAMAGLRERFSVPQDEALLVFHGTFSYPPNRHAIQVFAEILLPGLELRGLRCHLLAIGKDPPPSSPHQRIHFTGSVSDLAPWLKAADLAVIPLTDGGGTRMKIIDCFAAGLPVVSTSKGIEGIPVEPGKQALVVDDWQEMMDLIVGLWRDPEQRKSLAQAGAMLAGGLDWAAVADRYRSIYSRLA